MSSPFLKSSRYYQQKIDTTTTQDGRPVSVVTLRIIPPTEGDPRVVKQTERLDIISHQNYNDSTKFWYIADANTELEATKLLKDKIQTVKVPEF